MEELKVTVEEPSAVTRSITVEVPAAEVAGRFERVLRDYRRKAVQPGFRKGKVPADVIRTLYWGDVTADVARGLIGDTFEAAVGKVAVEPIAEPEFEITTLEEHQPFTYVAKVEVRPRFEPAGYVGIEVAGETIEVKDEELERLLEEVRQSHATVKKVEEARGLRDGDVAVITFEGTAGGAPIPGGSGKDFPVTLGSSTFPPGFEDNLIGATAGETREFTIRLPEQFGDAALAGKEALFTVTVSEVRERILPALDDEFAKDVGEYQGLEDLKTKMRENIRHSKEIALPQPAARRRREPARRAEPDRGAADDARAPQGVDDRGRRALPRDARDAVGRGAEDAGVDPRGRRAGRGEEGPGLAGSRGDRRAREDRGHRRGAGGGDREDRHLQQARAGRGAPPPDPERDHDGPHGRPARGQDPRVGGRPGQDQLRKG